MGLAQLSPQPADQNFDDRWRRAAGSVSGDVKKGLNSLVILGAWSIWRHRNDCVFNERMPNLSATLIMAGDAIWSWSMAGAKGFHLLAAQEVEVGT